MTGKICFRVSESLRCIDIFVTNSSGNFQNTTTVVNDLSNVHKMIGTVCENSFQESKPREISDRNYKSFDLNTFKNILRLKL